MRQEKDGGDGEVLLYRGYCGVRDIHGLHMDSPVVLMSSPFYISQACTDQSHISLMDVGSHLFQSDHSFILNQ
jgi:hypothetical protein